MKIITQTSKQAQLERNVTNDERTCPECNKLAIGMTVSKTQGIFNSIRLRQTKYSCFSCGCKWETEWK